MPFSPADGRALESPNTHESEQEHHASRSIILAADITPQDSERTDEIAVLEIEAVQLIARLLGVHHVLVHDEGCALGVVGGSLADLPVGVVRTRVTDSGSLTGEMASGDGVRTVPDRISRRGRRALLP